MTSPSDKRNDWWKPVLILTAVVAMLVAAKVFHLDDKLVVLRSWIESLGVWGPVVYIAIYIVGVVAALPGSAITLFAGALFGSVLGTVVVSIGSTVGAALSFLVARYFARGAVEGWVSKNEKFKKLDEMTARQGPFIVAITRLVPLFPFNLLNYGFGLTKVGFWPYVFWSWLCMLPGTVLYVVGADALTKGLSEGKIPWHLVGALIVIVVVLVVIVKIARKKLEAKG